jgi:hypothetical protein
MGTAACKKHNHNCLCVGWGTDSAVAVDVAVDLVRRFFGIFFDGWYVDRNLRKELDATGERQSLCRREEGTIAAAAENMVKA